MAAQDLVALAEAKAFLKKTGTADDAVVASLITRASDWLESLTGRKLKAQAFTDLRLTGQGRKLYPPAWPIDATATVTIKLDEIAQTVWRSEADGDVDQKDVVVASDDPWDERFGLRNHFYRWQGWESALGLSWRQSRSPADRQIGQNRVLLSYTGGYATVPEDLKQACLYLIQKLWRDLDQQRTGLSVIQVPGGGSVTIPDPTIPKEVSLLIGPYQRPVFVGV
jgi:hypothetical protein